MSPSVTLRQEQLRALVRKPGEEIQFWGPRRRCENAEMGRGLDSSGSGSRKILPVLNEVPHYKDASGERKHSFTRS